MKKALSLILSLCLIASLFIGISAGAYAEGEDKDIVILSKAKTLPL